MAAIERFRGDTKSLTVTIKDKDGTVIPVASCGLVLSVSAIEDPASEEEASYALQKSGSVVGDGTEGQFEFSFIENDVNFYGDYYYDFQFTDANGKTDTLAKDIWTMKQDITK